MVESNTLFVKGLAKGASERHLHAIFSQFGGLLDCQIARHRSGRSAGFAIITFSQQHEALTALQTVDNTYLLGRQLVVRWFQADKALAEKALDNDVMKAGKPDTRLYYVNGKDNAVLLNEHLSLFLDPSSAISSQAAMRRAQPSAFAPCHETEAMQEAAISAELEAYIQMLREKQAEQERMSRSSYVGGLPTEKLMRRDTNPEDARQNDQAFNPFIPASNPLHADDVSQLLENLHLVWNDQTQPLKDTYQEAWTHRDQQGPVTHHTDTLHDGVVFVNLNNDLYPASQLQRDTKGPDVGWMHHEPACPQQPVAHIRRNSDGNPFQGSTGSTLSALQHSVHAKGHAVNDDSLRLLMNATSGQRQGVTYMPKTAQMYHGHGQQSQLARPPKAQNWHQGATARPMPPPASNVQLQQAQLLGLHGVPSAMMNDVHLMQLPPKSQMVSAPGAMQGMMPAHPYQLAPGNLTVLSNH